MTRKVLAAFNDHNPQSVHITLEMEKKTVKNKYKEISTNRHPRAQFESNRNRHDLKCDENATLDRVPKVFRVRD